MVNALVTATIALSLVAVTGLSGQVSLTQFLFVGVGAFVAGKTFGGDSPLGMLLGGVVAAGVGVVVAVPAVRLRGLHLALCTFGMALAGREVVLGDQRVFGLQPLQVPRPDVLGFATSSDEAFATWCAIVFVALSLGVVAIRRSWFGRQLVAVRDSELAAATLGMKVRGAKLAIFAVSAFIAGCAGSIFGGKQGSVDNIQFEPIQSLVIVLFAFVGGITSITGALLAGVLVALLSYTQSVPAFEEYAGLVFGAIGAAAIALGRQPNGLAGIVYSVYDRIADNRGGPADPAPAPAGPPIDDLDATNPALEIGSPA
jgi:branched-chain amino acid transport system permease protein